MSGYAAQLWNGSARTYQAILEHPFVTGLTDGTLSRAAFAFYVGQDAHYLREYARALSLVSAHAGDEADIALFATHAAQAIAVERHLHGELLAALGVDGSGNGGMVSGEPAPATAAYTDFLVATCATGSFADGVAAVLPCYWIYAEVGKHLLSQGSPDATYARWIETYGGPEFGAVVDAVLAVTDRVGERLGRHDKERGVRLYAAGARYEWLFWDAAYRRLDWPSF